MRRPYAALILIIFLLITGLAVAGPFEDATKAYDRGDYKTAYRLWKPLAEQGVAEAHFNLGVMYANGQGVPQDYVLAHMWFNLATSRYPASEKEDREMAEKFRDSVASKMTPAQIAEAQRMSREWKPKKEVE